MRPRTRKVAVSVLQALGILAVGVGSSVIGIPNKALGIWLIVGGLSVMVAAGFWYLWPWFSVRFRKAFEALRMRSAISAAVGTAKAEITNELERRLEHERQAAEDRDRQLASDNQELSVRIAALEALRDAPKPVPELMARPDSVDCFLTIYGHWHEALTTISTFLFNHVYRAPEDASEEIKLLGTKTCQEIGARATEFQNLSDRVFGLRDGLATQERFDSVVSSAKRTLVQYNNDLMRWLREGELVSKGILTTKRYEALCELHAEAVAVARYNRFHSGVAALALILINLGKPPVPLTQPSPPSPDPPHSTAGSSKLQFRIAPPDRESGEGVNFAPLFERADTDKEWTSISGHFEKLEVVNGDTSDVEVRRVWFVVRDESTGNEIEPLKKDKEEDLKPYDGSTGCRVPARLSRSFAFTFSYHYPQRIEKTSHNLSFDLCLEVTGFPVVSAAIPGEYFSS